MGISTPAMQCDRRAIRIVLKMRARYQATSDVILPDTQGTVRADGDEAAPA
jgi:hypothetical protein